MKHYFEQLTCNGRAAYADAHLVKNLQICIGHLVWKSYFRKIPVKLCSIDLIQTQL